MKRMYMPWLRQLTCFLAGVLLVSVAASAQVASSISESGSASALLAADESFGSGASAAGGATDHSPNGIGRYHWKDNIAFEAGGGFNAPTPVASDYITWGGNFNVGAGLHLNDRLSILVEYQFLDDKLPKAIIGEAGAQAGHAHIWGFTLSPVYELFPKRRNSLYLTGGGGFYRKLTSFTDPVLAEYCNYYFCELGTANAVVGQFSSNQGGWNIGAGYAWKIGSPATGGRLKLFAEARYMDILTPAVTTEPNGLGTTSVAAGTELIPVTFGLRW